MLWFILTYWLLFFKTFRPVRKSSSGRRQHLLIAVLTLCWKQIMIFKRSEKDIVSPEFEFLANSHKNQIQALLLKQDP